MFCCSSVCQCKYWIFVWQGRDNFSVSLHLRIHWRLSTIFKTSSKSVWSNVFWYVKIYIFWKCIQYTIHSDKTQMLNKFSLDKINSTKNALVLLSWAPTHHSFTFNLWFLYELKHKVCLFRNVCGIFYFRFRFVFIKIYIFVRQYARALWLNSFQNSWFLSKLK